MDDRQPVGNPDDDPQEPLVYTSTGHVREEAEADVPAGTRETTRAEEEQAGEEYPGPEHGRRGDLGDSGPGED